MCGGGERKWTVHCGRVIPIGFSVAGLEQANLSVRAFFIFIKAFSLFISHICGSGFIVCCALTFSSSLNPRGSHVVVKLGKHFAHDICLCVWIQS